MQRNQKESFALSIIYLNEHTIVDSFFSRFVFLSYCFFFCLHFCLFCHLSHFKIIRYIVKSLIATSSFFFLEIHMKKENLESVFMGAQRGIPVSQMVWIRHWHYFSKWPDTLYKFSSSYCTILKVCLTISRHCESKG